MFTLQLHCSILEVSPYFKRFSQSLCGCVQHEGSILFYDIDSKLIFILQALQSFIAHIIEHYNGNNNLALAWVSIYC